MPCAPRSRLANLWVVAQLLSLGGSGHGAAPQPGQVRFRDRRQEHFIKALPEYHVVAPVRVDARGHFLSYGLRPPFTSSSRRKRDLESPEDWVYYRISHEEEDLVFNLTVNQEFLSKSYIVERRYGNLSHVKMVASSGPPCHLRGTVLQRGTRIGTAALSSCHGLSFVMLESMGRSYHDNFRLSSGSFILILGECAKQHCLVSVSSSKRLRRDGLSGPREAGTDTV
ncbi:A disintegrin and metalloproteinase with thrombospondin motifs 12 [Myotis brandtii]|uniref:A disintegrin and metalloproteinase with thrombospondin motifs 12 n=1 Tax=Myotis brandtii TaxID=109478 RepID=S7PT15_MYOBR|nr:A disintegrin and metalloproteinase with thrombospondin motifs 12 [Myotis brandtii]